MKRRQFLTTACVAGLAAASMQTATTAAESSDAPNLLDFRMVTASDAQRLEAMVKQYGEVTIPTVNKFGISPCGLFAVNPELNAKEAAYDKKYDNVMFSVTPHPTFGSSQELAEKLQNDTAYNEAYAAMMEGVTSKNPMFTAHQRMLLRCFPEFPGIQLPADNPNRILQLRMYRSHNFERSRAKAKQIATERGALDLFAECGIQTVFMSTTLFGSYMPSIVFMLAFESEDHKNDAWAKFVEHPEWKKIYADPAYADTVTEVINLFLKPCAGSQI